jgi:hypothetical protein
MAEGWLHDDVELLARSAMQRLLRISGCWVGDN